MWTQITLAYFLDLLIGDPQYRLHPVRVIGKLIHTLDSLLRKPRGSLRWNKAGGIVLVIIVCGLSYGAAYFAISTVTVIQPWMGFLLSVLIIYSSVAVKDMHKCSRDVSLALEKGNLQSARVSVARIVGRDTDSLSKEQIIQASVESIAENTVDGIIAPLFYAFIGGAPLAFLYRALNTIDSMIGYKNDKYSDFGWAAARLDDVFNYVPARINAVLVAIASFIAGKNGTGALLTMFKDGGKHPSPNSGLAEAAFAGALDVQLGGESTYEGIRHYKPHLGAPVVPLEISHIRTSLTITLICSILMVGLCGVLNLAIGGLL